MRIHVIGECPTAKAVRGSLSKNDFHLTALDPDWTIHIDEPGGTTKPALHSDGGELEQAVLRHLRKQPVAGVEIQTGSAAPAEIRIATPATQADRNAVEEAVIGALLELAKQALVTRLSKKPWWQKLFPA